jgi:hypothetical protein
VVIAAWLAEVPWEPLAPPAFPAPVAVVDADGPAAPLVIALGTGVVAAGPGGPTLGGRVEVGIGRGEGRLALRADLTFAEARSARLAGGAVRWSRTTLGLGPELRLGARTALVLDAGLLVARISSAGTGYDRDAEDQGFGAGAHAGARVARSFGPLDLWAGLRGLFWPFPQRVHVRAETGRTLATRTLGAGELHVAIGATLRARLGGAR